MEGFFYYARKTASAKGPWLTLMSKAWNWDISFDLTSEIGITWRHQGLEHVRMKIREEHFPWECQKETPSTATFQCPSSISQVSPGSPNLRGLRPPSQRPGNAAKLLALMGCEARRIGSQWIDGTKTVDLGASFGDVLSHRGTPKSSLSICQKKPSF